MAEKKFFVDVNLQGNNINNLKADTLDITSNLASANTKRIVYWSGQYYYSDGTSWIVLGFNYTPENVANKSTSTSLGTSDTLYPTQNAVKVYADSLLGDANALVYKGTIDCSTNPDYPAADAGYMYIASVAGKIGGASGTDVEVGDMIICNTDGTVSGNQATVGQYWNVIQKNIVGAVTGPASSINLCLNGNHTFNSDMTFNLIGPASSVSDNVVFFDGTTGKIIKDSGLTLSGSNTGDETTATIKTKLGIITLSGSNTGDQDLSGYAPLNPRVQTVASSATVTPVSTNDLVIITAQAAGLTLANPTGTFVEGQALMIRIKDNGTARTIAFGNNYRAIGITAPTTTVISKTMYLGIIYNSTDAKWDIVGLNQQA